MNQVTSETASPSTEVAENSGSGVALKSYEERAAEAFGGETPDGQSTTPQAAPAPDALAQARSERRAALEKMKGEERGRVDAMAALRERDQLRAELQAEREKGKAFERYIDPSKLTKQQFFELAEANPELSPKDLGEWMRERMANPEIAAREAATRAVDPKLSALESRLAEQQAVIDSFLKNQSQARVDAEERQAAEQFFAYTRENASVAPFSARFLEQHGAAEFHKVALRAAQNVPDHAGAQGVLDEIEEHLTALSKIYMPETGNPQRRQASPTPQIPAAAKAPTHVTNSLAQQRSSIVDENEDWASLPFEERSARLFR